MEYALIRAEKVKNVIVADEHFVASIMDEWDHIERLDTPEEVSLGVGIGWTWKDGKFTPPQVDAGVEESEPAWAWFIDPGSFTDRLGPSATIAIDTSAELPFVAIRADFMRRKWIDIRDQRVAATVGYLAGQEHPAFGRLANPLLTPERAREILTTPVTPEENMALRKLYFGG